MMSSAALPGQEHGNHRCEKDAFPSLRTHSWTSTASPFDQPCVSPYSVHGQLSPFFRDSASLNRSRFVGYTWCYKAPAPHRLGASPRRAVNGISARTLSCHFRFHTGHLLATTSDTRWISLPWVLLPCPTWSPQIPLCPSPDLSLPSRHPILPLRPSSQFQLFLFHR